MAKKKASVNKSAAIRDYLASHPGAKPKEIITALRKKGVDIKPGSVSMVLYGPSSKSAKSGGQRKKKAARRTVATAASGSGNASQLSAGDILAAKKLADQLGGIAATRTALGALSDLRK
ncbi:MAG: hypothetical protein O3A00_14420 [Planctomycetota bacterium]|nr:hypothetical protein [Planctomycetota bacterium]